MKYPIFAVLAAVFFAGCPDVLSPPETPVRGEPVLVVRIAGEPPAARTALPAMPNSVSYTIGVTRTPMFGPTINLGAAAGLTGSGPFGIPLSSAPQALDVVTVEGFAGGVKWAEGNSILPALYSGAPITIELTPTRTGTGDVALTVNFPAFSGGSEITAAEVSLYRSLAEYQAGNVYRSERYRKQDDTNSYGAGENLGSSIPLNYDNLPSGNYVVQVDFFRFKFVRVSRLIQTIIVRDGLTTNSWDGGGNTLNWTADKFASSNANLADSDGIQIGGVTVTGYAPTTYVYNISESTSSSPSSKALTVAAGTPGQKITVSLNGPAEYTLTSGDDFTLTPMKAANSIVIVVTAPDGVTKRTYAVSYTYYYNYGYGWTVGTENDSSTGKFTTVADALANIEAFYTTGFPNPWPGKGSVPLPARINITKDLTEAISVSDGGASLYTNLPPIMLTGANKTITNSSRPLTISKAEVILGDGLTLTGGNTTNSGGGVQVHGGGIFTMNGGTISGNTVNSSNGGGGVYVTGANSEFTMNGGTISRNTAYNGGGVAVADSGAFTMNGGTIGGSDPADKNDAGNDGGGVAVTGANSKFTMNGGTISGNTAYNGGGGVCVKNSGAFTMKGGSLIKNSASHGGGVITFNDSSAGTFIMEGGSISENTATAARQNFGGGGVLLLNNSNSFTMNGGTISGNTAENNAGGGGGVSVWNGANNTFTMGGGTISGNIAAGNKGGGVYFGGSGNFTMNKQSSVSGNTAADGGGGVYFDVSGTFTMNQQSSVSGNSAASGGGVYIVHGTFNMSAGSVSKNRAVNGNGGGVCIFTEGRFDMSAGSVSGNSASNGGGVSSVSNGVFIMSAGSIIGNSAYYGGGGAYNTGTINMSGGNISGNTAGDSGGGGVYNTGSFTMSGNSEVDTGNPVYLDSGKYITLSGILGKDPAANIEFPTTPGTQVLTGGNMPLNYTKFRLNGEAGKINIYGKIIP